MRNVTHVLICTNEHANTKHTFTVFGNSPFLWALATALLLAAAAVTMVAMYTSCLAALVRCRFGGCANNKYFVLYGQF